MRTKTQKEKVKLIGRKVAVALLAINFFLPQLANPSPVLITPDYIDSIQQKVNLCSIYPIAAKTKGWEGIVKVRFTISEDGRIKDIDIAKSSGYPLLDAAAMLAIKDASPYPFPDTCPNKEIELILPINFTQNQKVVKVLPLEPANTSEKPYQPPSGTVSAPSDKTNTSSLPIYNKESESIEAATKSLDISFNQFINTEPSEQPKESPAGQGELNTYIDVALKNNQPTQVAYEEIELAQLKVSEAHRSLYPNVKLSSYYTDGEVYKVGYQEGETKIQMDQPIFHGGELKDTITQAQVNLDITKKNYDRLKLDVINKTEIAYYNLVASHIHIRQKEEILNEAKDLMEKIEKLYSIGMAIPLELNSARAWYEQIALQIQSIKQELYMAELTLRQVMNIEGVPKISTSTLPMNKLDLSLNKCLELALQHRPEIYLKIGRAHV
jgi:TonB family protein